MLFSKAVDTRVENARWAAEQFTKAKREGMNDREAAQHCLRLRYEGKVLPDEDMALFHERLAEVQSVFDVSHTIAELENLKHLPSFQRHTLMVGEKSIQQDVFDTMDAELRRLSRSRQPASANRGMQLMLLTMLLIIGVGLLLYTQFQLRMQEGPRVAAATEEVPPIAEGPLATTPASPQALLDSPGLSGIDAAVPNLVEWYDRLQAARAVLDTSNPQAVAGFNKEAARYHAALTRARAGAAAAAATPTASPTAQ